MFRGRRREAAPFLRLATGTTPCGHALAKGIAEVDRDAVFAQEIRKRLVCQLLKRRHPALSELLQFIQRVVVKFDQLARHESLAEA